MTKFPKVYPTEEQEQKRLILELEEPWSRKLGLDAIYHIPNSGAGSQRGQGGKMKAMGVRAGVPDLFLPRPRGVYHGCYIEMKSTRPDAKVSDDQHHWLIFLQAQGYFCRIAYGCDEAKAYLKYYAELRKGER